MHKLYIGLRMMPVDSVEETEVRVMSRTRKPYDLPWRLDLANESPTGLDWGQCGGGARQLALALLADYLKNDARARQLYPAFAAAVVVGLDRGRWILSSQAIATALERIEASTRAAAPTAERRRAGSVSTSRGDGARVEDNLWSVEDIHDAYRTLKEKTRR